MKKLFLFVTAGTLLAFLIGTLLGGKSLHTLNVEDLFEED